MNKIYTAAAIGIAALASAASAQDMSVTVEFGDLDLSTPAGVAQFDRRIDRALAIVCDVHNRVDLRHTMASRKCWTAASQDVRGKRGQAIIVAQRGGKPSSFAVRAR